MERESRHLENDLGPESPRMTHRTKLIEVALPLEATNTASAREKSISRLPDSNSHE